MTIKDVYGVDNPTLPEGTKFKEFRPLVNCELANWADPGDTTFDFGECVVSYNSGAWRIILESV